MEIQVWLREYQTAARPAWRQFFKAYRQEATQAGPLAKELLERFIDLYPRGKQARGALAVLGYELAGGRKKKEMIKASVALELMETSVLIADDVFDDDDVRRGVETIHRQWESYFSQISSQNQRAFGRAMAHTTSIIGFHLVPLLLDTVRLPARKKQRALTFYCQSLVQTGYGEALDIAGSYEKVTSKQNWAQTIHEYKTVRYTTVLPLMFGALLAGNKPTRWLDTLEDYAQALGRIFQIQDDILGSFGDPAKTGKSNTNDLCQGRWTVLIQLLWKQASSQERLRLRRLLNKPQRGNKEIAWLKKLMQQYQIAAQAQQLAEEQLRIGERLIPRLTRSKKYQNLLIQLLHFMLERNK